MNNVQELNIYYTNINGLNAYKICQSDMIDDIKDIDIICLTETHLNNESEAPKIKGYRNINTVTQKEKRFGRNIKGITTYMKDNNDLKIEEIKKENGTFIILKLSNIKWRINEIFLIVCYNEPRESKYRDKNFFENIRNKIIKYKMKNIIILGDFNARIGQNNDNLKLGIPERLSTDNVVNINGNRLLEFCNDTSLIIANGRVKGDKPGKCTFHRIQKDKVMKSMIDYLIVSESIVECLTLLNTSEPVVYTDHSFMKMKFEIKVKDVKPVNKINRKLHKEKSIKPSKWQESKTIKCDKELFAKECQMIRLKIDKEPDNFLNTYQDLIIMNKKLKPNVTKNSKKVIYSDKTRELRKIYKRNVLDWKRNENNENLVKLMHSKRELNKNLKKENKINIDKKLQDLYKAKQENDHKKYWQLINSQSIKMKKESQILTANDFKSQIKENDKNITCVNNVFVVDNCKAIKDEILDNNITKSEIEYALKNTKTGKASGPDGITYEFLKVNKELMIEILQSFFNRIFNELETAWTNSWISPVYKKGDLNNIQSYRLINLSSSIEKVLTKIFNERINTWIMNKAIIHQHQTGFRKGNSVLDNILLLKEVNQIYKNTKRPIYLCFIDLSKAFDSVPKYHLINKLSRILPNGKFTSFISKLIYNKEYKILYKGKETESFNLKNGIPQGDSLSPTLFCIYINDLLEIIDSDSNFIDPVEIGSTRLSIVTYADDILLFSESYDGISRLIKIVSKYCESNHLKINYDKTKAMIRNVKTTKQYIEIKSNFEINKIEIVKEFTYLGMNFSNNNKKYIEELSKKGKRSAYIVTRNLKSFGNIDCDTIRNTFEMMTLSKMKFCGEFCFFNNLNSLNKVQFQFYKRFYHLKESTSHYSIIGEFGIQPIEFYFYKAALRYWLRIICNDKSILIKQVYYHISNNLNESQFSYTWCWRIKKLLIKLNLVELWNNQVDIEKKKALKLIDQRLSDYFREEWIKSAKQSHTGLKYLELCLFDNQMKKYVNLHAKFKHILTILKLRTGNSELAVVTGSYRSKLNYYERTCMICNNDEIEDIFHFMTKCSVYHELRQTNVPFLQNFDRVEFRSFMDNLNLAELRKVAMYVKDALQIRKRQRRSIVNERSID